jgi:hypothetical protein
MIDMALFVIPAPLIFLALWCRADLRKSRNLFWARLRIIAPSKFNELRQEVQGNHDRRSKAMVAIKYIHSGLYDELGDSTITQLGRKVSRLIVGTYLLSLSVIGYFYFLIIWHFQS